jgi:hypothetical protein
MHAYLLLLSYYPIYKRSAIFGNSPKMQSVTLHARFFTHRLATYAVLNFQVDEGEKTLGNLA